MSGWLMNLCVSAVIFMLLEFLLKGAIKDTARFAFGILFMALILENVIGRGLWVH